MDRCMISPKVRSEYCLADCLTKSSAKADELIESIMTGIIPHSRKMHRGGYLDTPCIFALCIFKRTSLQAMPGMLNAVREAAPGLLKAVPGMLKAAPGMLIAVP